MADPNIIFEVDFTGDATANASDTFVDLTDYVQSLKWRRGRNSETGDLQAGTIDVELDNTDGRFTPGNASSPYFPNVVPRRPCRVVIRDDAPGHYFILNSDFTSGTSGWTGTNESLSAAGGILTMTASNLATGMMDHYITSTPFLVKAGEHITVNARVNITSANSTELGLLVEFRNSSNVLIETHASGHPRYAHGWTNIVRDFMVPSTAGVSQATIKFFVNDDRASTVDVDYIHLTRAGEIQAFGYVERWPVTTGYDSTVTVKATDPTKYFSETELADSDSWGINFYDPLAYWPLNEDSSATQATSVINPADIALPKTFARDFGVAGLGESVWKDPSFGSDPIGTGGGTSWFTGTLYSVNPEAGSVLSLWGPSHPQATSLPWDRFLDPSTPWAVSLFWRLDSFAGLAEGGTEKFHIFSIIDKSNGHRIRFFYHLLLHQFWLIIVDPNAPDGSNTTIINSGVGPYPVQVGRTYHFLLSSNPAMKTFSAAIDGTTYTWDLSAYTWPSTVPWHLFYVGLGGEWGPGVAYGGLSQARFAHVALYQSQNIDANALNPDYILANGLNENQRIGRLANTIGLSDTSGDRAVQAGLSPMVRDSWNSGTSVMSLFRRWASAASGYVFFDKGGRLTYHNRWWRNTFANPVVFDADVGTGVEPGAEFEIDEADIINTVNLDVLYGVKATVQDLPSVKRYGAKPVDLTLEVTKDAEGFDAAAEVIRRYKEPPIRVNGVRIHASAHATGALYPLVRALDVGVPVTLAGLPNGAPASSLDFFCEAVQHTVIKRGGTLDWVTDVSLSPSFATNAFILDSDTLDSGAVLVY